MIVKEKDELSPHFKYTFGIPALRCILHGIHKFHFSFPKNLSIIIHNMLNEKIRKFPCLWFKKKIISIQRLKTTEMYSDSFGDEKSEMEMLAASCPMILRQILLHFF